MGIGEWTMSRRPGQAVSAKEIELAGSGNPEWFTRLCNALLWAAAREVRGYLPRLPAFTERLYAADQGVDAEWQVDLTPEVAEARVPAFLRVGWNVFQYKTVQLGSRTQLTQKLKAALKSLEDKHGRLPSNYVLLTNSDVTGQQQKALQEAIRAGCSNAEQVRVEVMGAGMLATLLNDLPHVRSAFFEPGFLSWEEARTRFAARDRHTYGPWLALIGREAELQRIRGFIQDPSVRAIVLTGPHQMGKTRLALESAADPVRENTPLVPVVFIEDVSSFAPSELGGLADPGEDVLAVVDDIEGETSRSFIDNALAVENVKVLLTMALPPRGSLSLDLRDDRVQHVSVSSLSDEDSRKLLQTAGLTSHHLCDWIVTQAHGNPGTLLLAAKASDKLKQDPVTFAQQIGRRFEDELQTRLGDEALKVARLLSVLSHVRVDGDERRELETLCQLFGDGVSSQGILDQLQPLESSGFLRRVGAFVEIVPPLLAGVLAASLLEGRSTADYCVLLGSPAWKRFLRRLNHIEPARLRTFWDALLGTRGPFTDPECLRKYAHVLREICVSVPERVLSLLQRHLTETPLEVRRSIANDARRELVWTLDDLIRHSPTCCDALRLMLLLAEAENETYMNNATGVFRESFLWLHPQVPISLDERLDLLCEFTRTNAPVRRQVLAVEAMANALESQGWFTRRTPRGLHPTDESVTPTSTEVWDYAAGILGLLLKLAERSEPPEVSAEAKRLLPQAAGHGAITGRLTDATNTFRKLCEWVAQGDPGIDVAPVSSVIGNVLRAWEELLQKREPSAEKRKEVECCLTRLRSFQSRITADFRGRLQKWVGQWHYAEDLAQDESDVGGRVSRYEREISSLAAEACRNPTVLNPTLLTWLTGPDAQKSHSFFVALGKADSEGIWGETAQSLAVGQCRHLFASYVCGWGQRDSAAARQYLLSLEQDRRIPGEAFLMAARLLEPDEATIARVVDKIWSAEISPEVACDLLTSSWWIDVLSDADLLRLLQALAGDAFLKAAVVIEVLCFRLHNKGLFSVELSDFAWRCIKADVSLRPNMDEHLYDELASKLTAGDPERGFRLAQTWVDRISAETEGKTWVFFHCKYNIRFWRMLLELDALRALRIVVASFAGDPVKATVLQFHLRGCVDLEKHRETLIQLAGESPQMAEVVGHCLTRGLPGFWEVAVTIAGRWSAEPDVLSSLTGAVSQYGEVVSGPRSERFKELRQEVQRTLADPATPSGSKAWLRELLSDLGDRDAKGAVWEYDVDFDELVSHARDRTSPLHDWSVGRMLKFLPWNKARDYLTVEDLARVLPEVDLPRQRRQAFEFALEVWQREP